MCASVQVCVCVCVLLFCLVLECVDSEPERSHPGEPVCVLHHVKPDRGCRGVNEED